MRRLDDFLIDRVFQRVSDALARWISCYGIAEFLLTGFLLGTAAWCFRQEKWFMLAALVAFVPRLLLANRLASQDSTDAIPRYRVDELWVREIFIVLQMISWPLSIVNPTLMSIISDFLWTIYVAALYFMACRANPPKRRRATAPSGAVHDVS